MNISLVKRIQGDFGFTEAQIYLLFTRAPHSYKTYKIPKKTGGNRTISQPAKETKYIQNWLISSIFQKNLPVHKCASAYTKDASIKNNATAHKNNQYFSKFDFRNFFTSIKEKDLVVHFRKNLKEVFTEEDIALIARISCVSDKSRKERCLSIGAPSSPILSNSVMYAFDEAINFWCEQEGVTYTRYADDLTFSTNKKNISDIIEQKLRETIRSLEYPRLFINNKKTIHISKKNQRRITGVIINNNDEISLGRERKRLISALVDHFTKGTLGEEDVYKLQGLLGFAHDIEPAFISRLEKKYTSKIITEIFKKRKNSAAP